MQINAYANANESWQSYLIWLSERGLAYPQLSGVMCAVEPAATCEPPVHSGPGRSESGHSGSDDHAASHSDAASRGPVRKLRLLAVSAAALTVEEGTLLSKMIAAMGLSAEQTMIWHGEPLVRDGLIPRGVSSDLILVLGPESGRLFDLDPAAWSGLRGRMLADKRASLGLLPITHPSDLIRQPQGKRQAWADLQVGMRSLGLPLQS